MRKVGCFDKSQHNRGYKIREGSKGGFELKDLSREKSKQLVAVCLLYFPNIEGIQRKPSQLWLFE